jgi:hypothetical protein
VAHFSSVTITRGHVHFEAASAAASTAFYWTSCNRVESKHSTRLMNSKYGFEADILLTQEHSHDTYYTIKRIWF